MKNDMRESENRRPITAAASIWPSQQRFDRRHPAGQREKKNLAKNIDRCHVPVIFLCVSDAYRGTERCCLWGVQLTCTVVIPPLGWAGLTTSKPVIGQQWRKMPNKKTVWGQQRSSRMLSISIDEKKNQPSNGTKMLQQSLNYASMIATNDTLFVIMIAATIRKTAHDWW